jgi:hypothetical protein
MEKSQEVHSNLCIFDFATMNQVRDKIWALNQDSTFFISMKNKQVKIN